MDKINAGHYFEIMDRLSVIQDNIEDHVREHIACSKEWKEEIDKAQLILSGVQSMAAGKWDEMTEDKT
jgi:hypothetical protein